MAFIAFIACQTCCHTAWARQHNNGTLDIALRAFCANAEPLVAPGLHGFHRLPIASSGASYGTAGECVEYKENTGVHLTHHQGTTVKSL